MKNIITTLIFILTVSLTTSASEKIGNLYYELNTSAKTAEVTYENANSSTNYYGLTSVTVPSSVTYNGSTYRVTSIGQSAFSKSKITSVSLPSSVKTIELYAFFMCTNLTSITLSSNLTTIGNSAFYYCSSLSSITFPNSLETIDAYAFHNCSALRSINLPSNLTVIDSYAFDYCTNLQTITFNSTRQLKLGTRVFQLSRAITEIYCLIDTPPTSTDQYVFDDDVYSKAKVYVYQSDRSRYASTAPWSRFANLVSVKDPEIEATSISLNKTSLELNVGSSEQLKATVYPSNTTNKTINWTSSNSSVASVSSSGLINALSPGKTTITAKCGSVSAYCTVTVTEVINVTEIKLNTNTLSLNVGSTGQLYATVNPSNATDKTITWSSSDNSIATVSNTGLVKGIAEGNATITAKCGNVSATCNVTVENPIINASSITLTPSSLHLYTGSTGQLTATVEPSNATDKTVTWSSSDNSIATVSNTGLVKGIAAGNATITAKCGNVSATCNVTVENPIINASSITLTPSSLHLYTGSTGQLTATVEPSNATDKTVVWTSSDELIATVSDSGIVEAIAEGEAVITASCGTVTAVCQVSVEEYVVNPTQIKVTPHSIVLFVGSTGQLSATVEPSNTTDKTISWISNDDSVATVSEEGLVTAIAPGIVNITALCGAVNDYCEVLVEEDSGIWQIISDENCHFDILSLEGQILYKNADAEKINGLSKGIYLIRLDSGTVYKIIK